MDRKLGVEGLCYFLGELGTNSVKFIILMSADGYKVPNGLQKHFRKFQPAE